MARSRNIKPAFFTNEELAELEPLARLAFIAMWTLADFKGCLELKSRRLKLQTLPYDDCDIDAICESLNKSGLIRIYSVQGRRYIKITNFEKHQNPHKNERDAGSDIPDIDGNSIQINDLTQDGTKPDKIGTARADSLILIPSTLIPDSLKLIQNKKEQRGSRLASDFVLSKTWGDWALVERPDLDPRRVADEFKDYWVSVPGAKGVKLDWQATWRNWVRSQKANRANPADVARQTVPSSGEHEKTRAAMLKTFEGAKPPSIEQLEKLRSVMK